MNWRRNTWKRPRCGLIDYVSESEIRGWLREAGEAPPAFSLHVGEKVVDLKVRLTERADVQSLFPRELIQGFAADLPAWLIGLNIATPAIQWHGRGWLECDPGVDQISEGMTLGAHALWPAPFPKLQVASSALGSSARLPIGTGAIRLQILDDCGHGSVELPISLGMLLERPFAFVASITGQNEEEVVTGWRHYLSQCFEGAWLGSVTMTDLLTAIGYHFAWKTDSGLATASTSLDLQGLLTHASLEMGRKLYGTTNDREAVVAGAIRLLACLNDADATNGRALSRWLGTWLTDPALRVRLQELDQLFGVTHSVHADSRDVPVRANAHSSVENDNLLRHLNPSDWQTCLSPLWVFVDEAVASDAPFGGPMLLTDWGQNMKRTWSEASASIEPVPGGALVTLGKIQESTVEAEIDLAVQSNRRLHGLKRLEERIWKGPHRKLQMPSECIHEWVQSHEKVCPPWTKTLDYLANRNREISIGSTTADVKFSVIMAARNRAPLIGRAIRSVVDQTHKNWELLVIDDGSSDATSKVAKAFHDDRLRIVTIAHQGVSTARNVGMELAAGHYVVFCDSDNMMCSNFLESLNLHAGRREWGYSRIARVGDNGFDALGEPYDLDLLQAANYIDQGAIYASRDFIRAGVKFDDNLTRSVDLDFALRLAEHASPSFSSIYAGLATTFSHQDDRIYMTQPAESFEQVWFEWACRELRRQQSSRGRSVVVRIDPEDMRSVQTIASMAQSAGQDEYEWIVVGDGSSAEFWAVAGASLSRVGVAVFPTFSNFSPMVQLALGASRASGEYLALFEPGVGSNAESESSGGSAAEVMSSLEFVRRAMCFSLGWEATMSST